MGAPAILKASSAPPNVLILMTDQQRSGALGCYGLRATATPNLDRLAAEGALFENCYVNNPICTPSRASMLTGKSLPGHGVYKLYDNLPDDQVLFPKRLQQAGYRTALFGKLHVSGRLYEAARRHPQDGFDIYEWCLEPSIHLDSPFNGYARWLAEQDPAFLARLKAEGRKLLHTPRHLHMTHWAAESTIDFIRRSGRNQPFFCLMSIFDPHNPYDGYPLEMDRLVDRTKIAEPLPAGAIGQKPYGIRYEHEHSYLGAFRKFSREDLRTMRSGYYAAIALADLEMGRVLAALEEKGIADNTLVIFTSDHGDMLGDHGLLVKGAFFYEACTKVPLVMRWPGRIRGGLRLRQLAQLNDVAATVLAASGCLSDAVQNEMPESRNLLGACAGRADHTREYAICSYRNTGIFDTGAYADPAIHATMLRDPRYKLNVYHAPAGRSGGAEGELYDMEADPDESVNVWNQPGHSHIRGRMTESLLAWLVAQDVRSGSRGGEMVPPPSQKLTNAIR